MQSLTVNEARVIDFLLRNFQERYSINQVAKKVKISPRGAYKILKKLENINALLPEKIGNAIYYKVNLNEQMGLKLAEFVLVQNELNAYSQLQSEDLKPIKELTQSCILYGSVLTKGKEANDIDILLVMDKKDYSKVISELNKIRSIKPKKIHEMVQTKEDLISNIRKKDEVLLDIIKKGKILWGAEVIVEAIKNSL